MTCERTVVISHEHPSLAGHFPGHPVVPGVVLLNEVLCMVREGAAPTKSVTGLPMVKFSSPLRPGEAVTIDVDLDEDAGATFSCRVETRLVASGTIELARQQAISMERM